MALKRPQYTQFPNELIDEYMPKMTGAAFKVAVTIARYTLGFHRTQHYMSLSFLAEKTGMSRQSVLNGVNSCIDMGIVEKRETDRTNVYKLLFEDDSPKIRQGESKNLTTPSLKIRPEVVKKVDTIKDSIEKKDKETTTTTIGGRQKNSTTPSPPVQENTSDEVPIGIVYSTYESNIGTLAPLIAEKISDDFDTYGGRMLVDAIQIAVENNVRKWRYVQGILKRWQTEGRGERKQNGAGGYSAMNWS